MTGTPRLLAALLAATAALHSLPAHAVEGGIGAYFLGTRDTLAGIVPPPGDYLSFTYDRLSGSVEGVSIGGLPIAADVDVDLNLVRLGYTHAFDTTLWGGTPAINVNVPILDTSLAYTTVTPPLAGLSISDDESGIGDVSLTGLVGWHRDKLHYSAGVTVYIPSGTYATATVDVPNRSIDALSNSKNVWSKSANSLPGFAKERI